MVVEPFQGPVEIRRDTRALPGIPFLGKVGEMSKYNAALWMFPFYLSFLGVGKGITCPAFLCD